MNSDDGSDAPASGRDGPPPPPAGAGGSSKGRRSASVDDGPAPPTRSRGSVLADDETPVESRGGGWQWGC
eukprot:6818587-Lingulodinium_polyedra.AAC.1